MFYDNPMQISLKKGYNDQVQRFEYITIGGLKVVRLSQFKTTFACFNKYP